MMTKLASNRLAAVCCCWLASAALASAVPAAEDLNRVVLRVNDKIVTLHDYEFRKADEIARILATAPADERQEQLAQVGKGVMQGLFTELLITSFADQHGIRVSDSEVDDAVEDLRQRQGISSQEELLEMLDRFDMTMEQLRSNARRDLIWNQVIAREVNAKIEVGEEELRAYYRNHSEEFEIPEQRWLQEIIVLESSDLGDAELEALAEKIRGEIEDGGDLESAAAAYRDQELTTGVIDLGWLRKDEIGKQLVEAAWALEVGDFSAPIRARGGFHVLHLVERKEARQRPFTEVQDEILRQERNKRFNKKMRTFMATAEQQAYVYENLPPDAVGYRSLVQLELEDELEMFRAPVSAPQEPAEP